MVTDANGAVVGTQGYYPYGETRYTTGSLFTDRLFTGQQDTGLGLYNFKARFVDPALGKFISPDTITPGGRQGINKYAYVLDNPINAIDPTGHDCKNVDMSGHAQQICAPGTKTPVAPTGSKSLISGCDFNMWACKKVDMSNLDKALNNVVNNVGHVAAKALDDVAFGLEVLDRSKILESSKAVGLMMSGAQQGLGDLG